MSSSAISTRSGFRSHPGDRARCTSAARVLLCLGILALSGCENDSATSPSAPPSLARGKPAGNGITITILGTLGGASSAQAVNDNGAIAGYSTTAGGIAHAVVWSNGQILDLGPGQATDINGSGTVVGFNGTRALLWAPRLGGGYETPVDLGTLGGPSSRAEAINDAGQVTGESVVVTTGDYHAYLRSGSLMSDIHPATGPLAGGTSYAFGMNGAGNVVGQWNGVTTQSFLWTPAGGMQLLPTLGGTQGVALDMNDNGQVVGWSDPAPGQQLEAYIYETGTMRRLGTLGAAGSVALAINRQGVVVGRATTTRRTAHAFYWTASGGMKDPGLPSGSSFGQALDVNAGGVIVGEVTQGNGQLRAIVWRLPQP